MSSHYGERCAAEGMAGSLPRDINPEEYDGAGNELTFYSLHFFLIPTSSLSSSVSFKLLPPNKCVQLIKRQILVIILNLAPSVPG